MRFLWYALCVLFLLGGLRAIMTESLSGPRGLGFVCGALIPTIIFFWLGIRSSRIAARAKAQKQQQSPPQHL